MRADFFKTFRPIDFVILLLFFFAVLASFFLLRTGETAKNQLVIKTSEKEFIYSLEKNRELEIDGALGTSVIVIQDGRAFFKSSPCTNKTCVHMGAVSAENDWAACLPNDVFIRVE